MTLAASAAEDGKRLAGGLLRAAGLPVRAAGLPTRRAAAFALSRDYRRPRMVGW